MCYSIGYLIVVRHGDRASGACDKRIKCFSIAGDGNLKFIVHGRGPLKGFW